MVFVFCSTKARPIIHIVVLAHLPEILTSITCFRGHAVAQLVEALRYKSEGRRFDSRWCHWNFSLTQSFRPHYSPGVDSASNRNEYQECFLGVWLTTLPPSCADCLEIWKPHPPETLSRPVMGLLYLYRYNLLSRNLTIQIIYSITTTFHEKLFPQNSFNINCFFVLRF
jgi:hypothetical protein